MIVVKVSVRNEEEEEEAIRLHPRVPHRLRVHPRVHLRVRLPRAHPQVLPRHLLRVHRRLVVPPLVLEERRGKRGGDKKTNAVVVFMFIFTKHSLLFTINNRSHYTFTNKYIYNDNNNNNNSNPLSRRRFSI